MRFRLGFLLFVLAWLLPFSRGWGALPGRPTCAQLLRIWAPHHGLSEMPDFIREVLQRTTAHVESDLARYKTARVLTPDTKTRPLITERPDHVLEVWYETPLGPDVAEFPDLDHLAAVRTMLGQYGSSRARTQTVGTMDTDVALFRLTGKYPKATDPLPPYESPSLSRREFLKRAVGRGASFGEGVAMVAASVGGYTAVSGLQELNLLASVSDDASKARPPRYDECDELFRSWLLADYCAFLPGTPFEELRKDVLHAKTMSEGRARNISNAELWDYFKENKHRTGIVDGRGRFQSLLQAKDVLAGARDSWTMERFSKAHAAWAALGRPVTGLWPFSLQLFKRFEEVGKNTVANFGGGVFALVAAAYPIHYVAQSLIKFVSGRIDDRFDIDRALAQQRKAEEARNNAISANYAEFIHRTPLEPLLNEPNLARLLEAALAAARGEAGIRRKTLYWSLITPEGEHLTVILEVYPPPEPEQPPRDVALILLHSIQSEAAWPPEATAKGQFQAQVSGKAEGKSTVEELRVWLMKKVRSDAVAMDDCMRKVKELLTTFETLRGQGKITAHRMHELRAAIALLPDHATEDFPSIVELLESFR